MGKATIQIGKWGSILGGLAGIIEMSIGSKILPWIGNKENPVGLGIITLLLSGLAFLSVLSARKTAKLTNDHKMMAFLGFKVACRNKMSQNTKNVLFYVVKA